ncbi:MAG: sodium:alanine symporter family protein [Deltaproteobacteria bacterium]|nr:sodium:alanine symporter family protein [Deltaproteobacteria bacterium]
MTFMDNMTAFTGKMVSLAWGTPLIILLVGGGLALTLYSRFLPFTAMGHALKVLTGKYDKAQDPGDISHFQALSTALSATIGLGNIGGVAVAVTQGGPGALFWMWVAAIVGMATKFFTGTLSVMYRGKDSLGRLQGGPMYYMEVGLGERFKPLAGFFAFCGLVGTLAMFQSNQLCEVLHGSMGLPTWIGGLLSLGLVSLVILGGVKRIATVASRLVPAMCLLYLVISLVVVFINIDRVPGLFASILDSAFKGYAIKGGSMGIAVMAVVRTGVKRAAFSNEAGIGTAPLAHGAAKTREPVREGLVAMLGPFIDTIVICTLTGLVVLLGGDWSNGGVQGVTLTLESFHSQLGWIGSFSLVLAAALFGLSTMFSYSYYGRKCFAYLFGAEHERIHDVIYLVSLFLGAVWSVEVVVNILDTAFALMAVPNMIATLLLSRRVMSAARDYFHRMK